MSGFRSEDEELRSERKEVLLMTAVAEASTLLRDIAGPTGSVKERINRAARAVALTVGRAEDIWRGEARMVRAEEMDRIRREHAARQRRLEIERADRDALGALLDRIDLLEQRLAAFDPDVARAMGSAARGTRA